VLYVVFVDCIGATYFYFDNFPITSHLTSIGFKPKAWYNLLWLFGSILFVLFYIHSVLAQKHLVFMRCALLIWWLVVTPILFFDAYNTEADWNFANLKRQIIVFANIFMYSIFIIGLIVSKPEIKD